VACFEGIRLHLFGNRTLGLLNLPVYLLIFHFAPLNFFSRDSYVKSRESASQLAEGLSCFMEGGDMYEGTLSFSTWAKKQCG
jgi:hypothetical protein